MDKYLKSACFYTIRKCKVSKPNKEEYETPKYCLSVLSDRAAGFLVSSKPRKIDIRKIKIFPKEINKHILQKKLNKGYGLTHTSYANLAELKNFDKKEIASAIELCPIPCSVARKIVEALEEMFAEDFVLHKEDKLELLYSKKIVAELKTLVLRSR